MHQHLTGWHTVTEVSLALAVPSHNVRRFFMHVYHNGEASVQMAENPRRLLIDTESECYQQFVQQHGQQEQMPTTADAFSAGGSSLSQSLVLNWSALRQWLTEEGVLIFFNVLAEEPHWQWQWKQQTGEGYGTIEDAVLAALQARMARTEEEVDSPAQEEAQPIPTARLFWFGSRCPHGQRREPPDHWL